MITDVRLSVTDRCNYRCRYCMAPDHKYMPRMSLLSLPQFLRLARVLAGLHIEKIRITGGEPVLYRDLDPLIAGLSAIGFKDICMTTNGSRVDDVSAQRWSSLGLDRLTLSLDSLRPDRYASITRSTMTPQGVIDAIACARRAGLGPIKVNVVIMRGVNDDELLDFADFAARESVDLRLIEWMPLDSGNTWSRADVVSADEMLAAIRSRHTLRPIGRDTRHGTSLNYEFAGGSGGRIGVIASVTRPFCGACSRLRITADGRIRPCLFSHDEWDISPLLNQEAPDEEIARFLQEATWTKQAGHGIGTPTFRQPERGMSAIGG